MVQRVPVKIDPELVRMVAETMRAEIITRPDLKLSPGLLQKIQERVPIFKGLGPERIAQVLGVAERCAITAGEEVFREGDLGNSFYIVIAGEVAVEKSQGGAPVLLARLGSGHCFGEMALVTNHARSATVRALEAGETFRFYRDHVDAMPEVAHIIYRNIARILAARLDDSSEMLASLARRQSGH